MCNHRALPGRSGIPASSSSSAPPSSRGYRCPSENTTPETEFLGAFVTQTRHRNRGRGVDPAARADADDRLPSDEDLAKMWPAIKAAPGDRGALSWPTWRAEIDAGKKAADLCGLIRTLSRTLKPPAPGYGRRQRSAPQGRGAQETSLTTALPPRFQSDKRRSMGKEATLAGALAALANIPRQVPSHRFAERPRPRLLGVSIVRPISS
jgi:hypothetical protein